LIALPVFFGFVDHSGKPFRTGFFALLKGRQSAFKTMILSTVFLLKKINPGIDFFYGRRRSIEQLLRAVSQERSRALNLFTSLR